MRIPMMAMTTNSSTRVNANLRGYFISMYPYILLCSQIWSDCSMEMGPNLKPNFRIIIIYSILHARGGC
jgi:hypothetical protein